MSKEITLPKLSEDVDEGTVAEVLVQKGDSVKEDDPIIAVESDKATVEVPCPKAGTVDEIKVSTGDTIKTGDVILHLDVGVSDEAGEKESEEDKKKPDTEESSESGEKEEKERTGEEINSEKEEAYESEERKEAGKSGEREEKAREKKGEENEKKTDEDAQEVPAAPGAKRLARENEIDLTQIESSGPDGLITEDDVRNAGGLSGKEKDTHEKLPDFSRWGAVEREPLTGTRKATAKKTHRSWREIPHVTQFDEAGVSGILSYIEEKQDEAREKGGKLTITAVLAKLIATVLHQFPKFNASIDMAREEAILKKYIHIGIAVDTEEGLLVPIVRDVDQKSITDLAVEITELAEKAREGQLSKEEMEGGNIVISNLGGIGGTQFTPIIYHPHVAILGVSEIEIKPVFDDGSFEPGSVLPLSLSYDHRLIDGAEGARFLRYLCNALEDPYKALLGD